MSDLRLAPMTKGATDDFIVLSGNRMVGSIHRVYRPIPEPWRWRTGNKEGWCADLETAKKAFREAWDA